MRYRLRIFMAEERHVRNGGKLWPGFQKVEFQKALEVSEQTGRQPGDRITDRHSQVGCSDVLS
jgi:hypothetical protein